MWQVANFVMFYVDNYLNTYDRECDLITQQPTLDELMNEAHMPLQEWVSNSYNHFI